MRFGDGLDEVPLEDLLALSPEGKCKFFGVAVDGEELKSTAMLTHDVPDGPVVSTRRQISARTLPAWKKFEVST